MIFASFQAGQIGMLDITDRYHFTQMSVVDLGFNAGPHNHLLSADNTRLVVSDYFLDEDDFGKVHFDGDHIVHLIDVSDTALSLDHDFALDFDTAFDTGPARPHGMAMK
jgi:selenium-binding protein 1